MMGLIFVGGAFFALWGMAKVMPWRMVQHQTGSQHWLAVPVAGRVHAVLLVHLGQHARSHTVGELDDCEDQLEALKKEIRKIEAERDEFDRRLPPHTVSLKSACAMPRPNWLPSKPCCRFNTITKPQPSVTSPARKRAGESADALTTCAQPMGEDAHATGYHPITFAQEHSHHGRRL